MSRWRVWHWPWGGPEPWAAARHGCEHGNCRCDTFPTHAEALTYATRQADADALIAFTEVCS